MSSPASDGRHWTELRVTFYDSDKTQLMAVGVAPAWRLMSEGGAYSFWLTRSWQGGPHLSLYAAGADEGSTERAASLLRNFVSAHPSARPVPEAERRSLHERLCLWEALVAPYTPWRPDNEVTLTKRAPDLPNFPSVRACELAVESIGRALPLIFETMAAAEAQPPLRNRAGAALLLTYARALGPLEHSYFFMRAYVEKILVLAAEDMDATKSRFAAVYQQKAAQVASLVSDILNGDRADVRAWSDYAIQLLVSARAAAENDDLVLRGEEAVIVYDAAGWASSKLVARSAFTRELIGASWLWERIESSPLYTAHMFAVNRIYGILTLLGINAKDKLLLLDLLARHIEDVHGIDPVSQLRPPAG